jgi:uncharacterized membrane-anchored protein
MSILINGFAAICFLAALGLVWRLFEEIKNQGSPKTKRRPARRRPRARRARAANRGLEAQLLSLLQNDAQIAHRLVKHARKRHPGRSENWYWEKAISDLERDRR